jgi:serine/threonine protein kinase
MKTPNIQWLRRMESICSRFEHQLLEGDASIEPFLLEVDVDQRQELLAELIGVDIEHRLRRGETTDVDHYMRVANRCSVGASAASIAALLDECGRTEDDVPQSDRYQFLEKIGSGGNGDVWKAFDNESQRPLAIKLLRVGPDGDHAADARLDREALVTGKLQHPGIPPIFDRGRLADGRPYFAMKLVGGQTLEEIIHRYAEKDRPTGCLGIFEQLSQTVAYAHSQGVIHRDIKPRNVMVGDFGEVQVMDWGLAKRLGTGDPPLVAETDETTGLDPPSQSAKSHRSIADTTPTAEDDSWEEISRSLTVAGDVMGTPAYMAPEQARGEIHSLDRRTDVYTLGTILFEILTGERFHADASVVEAMRRTAMGEFDEACERLERVEGHAELCSLCRRCLQFEPDSRPADASLVADGVSAYLASAEKRARQADTERREAAVRSAEDLKHRRLQTRTAVLVAAVSFIGAAIAFWQWRQASNANARANAALVLADDRFEQAQTVVDEFLSDVADEEGLLARLPGAQPIRQQLLQKARDYYEGFLAEAGDDPLIQLEAARAYGRLGDIAMIVDPGGEELMNYRTKVIELCDQLLIDDPTNAEIISTRADSYRAIGSARSFAKQHKLARDAYETAKRGYEHLVDARGTDSDQFELAKVFQNLGRTSYELRRLDESEAYLAEALRLAEPYLKEHSDDAETVRNVRAMHVASGIVYGWGRGKWPLCSKSFEKALELSTLASELASDQFTYLDDVATDQMNLAMSYNHIKNHDAAETKFRQCIATREKLVRENPSVVGYREDLAQVCGNFATYSFWRGRLDAAVEFSGRSCELYDELVAAHPSIAAFRKEADQANQGYLSHQIQLDLKSGLDASQAFKNAQSELERIVARLIRYSNQFPENMEYRIDAANCSSFLANPPLQSLLEMTDIVDKDPELIPKRKEYWIATRALVLVRNDRHDDAVELFKKYGRDLKDMQSWLIQCLAHLPSERDAAIAMFQSAEKKWIPRKHSFFHFEMLRAETKNAFGDHPSNPQSQ